MIYSKETDETLVSLTLSGNDRAYEELVVRYQKAVISSAYSVTKCRHLAEDAAQDAFVSAWIKLNMLKEYDKYGAWVCRIARNCAINSAKQFREYVGSDFYNLVDDVSESPEDIVLRNSENEQLHRSVNGLTEKVRTIINLYYFEGLSIIEIADRMSIPVGTVKYRLHTGRKQIRKDYDDMYNVDATLLERVMKSVRKLKLWRLKRYKGGFGAEYEKVLADVESLPESIDKNSALADVLCEGYWWNDGEHDDKMLERINDLAVSSKNEEVLSFLLAKERNNLNASERMAYIRDKQIPRIEAIGFDKTLGELWFWLGKQYYDEGEIEKGREAYSKAKEYLAPVDLLYSFAFLSEKFEDEYKKAKNDDYIRTYSVGVNEIRDIEGRLCSYKSFSYDRQDGRYGFYSDFDNIFELAYLFDHIFYDKNLKVGESLILSNKHSSITFVSNNDKVNTSCGNFENCEHWYYKGNESEARADFHIWYKNGIGIVRIEKYISGFDITTSLKEYNIVGGKGIFPMAQGNRWSYVREGFKGYCENVVAVSYSDSEKAIVTQYQKFHSELFDENDWEDMIKAIRRKYFNGQHVCDVSSYIERAEALAQTEFQKTYTRSSSSVVKRIMANVEQLNPQNEYETCWNFFEYLPVRCENGTISAHHAFDKCFELKKWFGEDRTYPLLYNDVYMILVDNTGYIWKDEWAVPGEYYEEFIEWTVIKTHIKTELCEPFTTASGKFEKCLRVSLDSEGFSDGMKYRCGKRDYYFAEGVGIVKVVIPFKDDEIIYELTDYCGVGEGYFPLGDGFTRHYKLSAATEDIGETVYDYQHDEKGRLIIFADRRGDVKKERED